MCLNPEHGRPTHGSPCRQCGHGSSGEAMGGTSCAASNSDWWDEWPRKWEIWVLFLRIINTT